MDVLPAIDFLGGKVVRLSQGDYARQTTYDDDPVSVARQFVSAGARWIHMVDLDAARSGRRTNSTAIGDVCQAVAPDGVKVECGGGIRDTDAVEALVAAGAARLVIGSAAMKNWPWFEDLLTGGTFPPRMLALGLDARDGLLAAEGWTEQLALAATELAGRVRGTGLGAIVYTDIARDGMLSGTNIPATGRIVDATDVPVIASGGLASIEDVRACGEIGCAGVIVGRAWYEGGIDLARACQIGREISSQGT
jgi:phosphoribosylformimino-5-aminoimidazole carboxamide ribotide isomerase